MTSRYYDKSWKESWKTPEIRAAEAQMDAVARQVDKTLANIEKLHIPPTPP